MTDLAPPPRRPATAWPTVAAIVGLLAVTAAVELLMGRLPISKSGHVMLWVGDVHSHELSQQVLDPYSFSHVIHGFLFYALTWAVGRGRWSVGRCLLVALAIECAWEMAENSPVVIARYRQTASQDYTGDTVLNSLSDAGCCALGFAVAARIPVWATVTMALAMEVGCGCCIRDNLALNVIMLLHPFESIRRWQSGG